MEIAEEEWCGAMTARMTGGAEAEDAGAGYVHKIIT